jgi:hypothetical protein
MILASASAALIPRLSLLMTYAGVLLGTDAIPAAHLVPRDAFADWRSLMTRSCGGGTSILSSLAVPRFMMSSNLTACWIGNLAMVQLTRLKETF